MTAMAQKYKESYSRFYLWFLGSGQYWVLGFLIVATMLSYRARYAATMSPFDEATYLDSILSLPDNMIAQRGEFYGDDIREKFACDGVYYFGTSGPPCGGDYSEVERFPQYGKNTADAYTPIFFWVTWVFARVFSIFGIDIMVGARLVMIIYGTAAFLVLYKTMRMLNVPIAVGYTTIAFALTSPFVWWTYTFVTTDSTVLLIGALALFVTIRFLQGAGSLWPLVAVGVLGMALKITNILAIGLAGLIVLMYVAFERFSSDSSAQKLPLRSWLVPGLVSVFAALGTHVTWEVIRHLIALGDSPDQGISMERNTIGELINQAQSGFGSLVSNGHGESISSPFSFLISRFLVFLIIAAVIGMMLKKPASQLEFSLAWATGIAAVIFLPILFIIVQRLVLPFSIPARYAAAILPAMFLCVGLSIRWAGARWLMGTVAAGAWIYVVFSGMTYL